MTDLEKLKALLGQWGVPFSETVADRRSASASPGQQILVVEQDGHGGKVNGYGGFFTDFTFTPEGQFVSMGAWE